VDHAHIAPKLQCVIAVNPGDVVGKVMDWRDSADGVKFTIRLKDETEVGVVAVAIPTVSEGLAGIAVAEVVYDVVADAPRVSRGETPGMVPDRRRGRIRQLPRKRLVIVDHIPANEHILTIVEIEIQFCHVRVQLGGRRGIETKTARI